MNHNLSERLLQTAGGYSGEGVNNFIVPVKPFVCFLFVCLFV